MAKVERTHNYNGNPLMPGEVLVLTPYDKDDVIANCTNKENVVTVQVAGRVFKAVLKAVPIAFRGLAINQFNSWTRSQISDRPGRCMVPQKDGSLLECARIKGDNHPTCSKCPDKGKYQKKIKANISIDYLEDEFGYSAATINSVEDEYINWESLTESQLAFLHKIEQLITISPKHALAMLLMALGIKGAELAERLQIGHDAANRVRHQVAELAPDRIDSIDQIDVEGLKANKSKLYDHYRKEAYKLLDTVIKLYFNC